MSGPFISIDTKKIQANAAAIVSICAQHSISVTGVTKVSCGNSFVAKAMIAAGVTSIGESRLENIQRLRSSGIFCPIMLLRIPPLSAVDQIVSSVDISLNSELSVIRALSDAAHRRLLKHHIILMVDLGDLREGIWPDDLASVVSEVKNLPGVTIVGIGTNLTCYGGVIPSEQNMNALIAHARMTEQLLGYKLTYISGGNTSTLPLLMAQKLPAGINHLRIGEGILLGKETINRTPIINTFQDAFTLSAEIIELKEKPSIPIGELGEDAFGNKPQFQDHGIRLRAILNIGREDVAVDGLQPLDSNASILGASSDHLIVDVTNLHPAVSISNTLRFQPNYAALLAAMTSAYVEKKIITEQTMIPLTRKIHVLYTPEVADLTKAMSTYTQHESVGSLISASTLVSSQDNQSLIRTVSNHVTFSRASEQIPLIMCSERIATIGAVAGLAHTKKPYGLLWIDSKASLHDIPNEDPVTSSSTLTYIIESTDNNADIPVQQRINVDTIVVLGIDHALPVEAWRIAHHRIKTFTMEDIDLFGIREVTTQALRHVLTGTAGFILHFNLSAVTALADPENTDGLTSRELYLCLELIASTGQLQCLCMNGISSALPLKVQRKIEHFILTSLGKKILSTR